MKIASPLATALTIGLLGFAIHPATSVLDSIVALVLFALALNVLIDAKIYEHEDRLKQQAKELAKYE